MQTQERLHALDALRAFALLLGVFFHAALSFVPGDFGWAIRDNSPSMVLAVFVALSHVFRMSLFFFIAGFFAHLVYHRRGAEGFIRDRSKRILLPFIVGWCAMVPLLSAIWAWSKAKSGATSALTIGRPVVEWSVANVPLTHLWFLYYLLLLYVFVIGVRYLIVRRLDASGRMRVEMDKVLLTLVEKRWLALVFSVPVAAAAIVATGWNPGGGMPTPDHSLYPELISFVGYSTALAGGWLFERNRDLLELLCRRVKSSFWLALLCCVLTTAFASTLQLQPTLLPPVFRFLAALSATAMMWYFNFALVGLALKKFSEPSPRIRYVADSSYWLYIAHLPIVCALQVWVAHWPLHWSVKYPFIMGIALGVLFASYHYCVRYTFIGAVLNGRKRNRSSTQAVSAQQIVLQTRNEES